MGAPRPVGARTFDDLAASLAELREWSGSPSYAEIGRRIRAQRASRGIPPAEQTPGRVTIYDCFRPGRKRLDIELVCDIVAALGAADQIPEWRLAHAALTRGTRLTGRSIADVLNAMPAASAAFTGRTEILGRLAAAQSRVQIISGMPGVGKTEVALVFAASYDCDVQLYVNLHGYDSDLHPVDADSVLTSVLRQLGQHSTSTSRFDLAQKSAATQQALRERRALLLLDNARDAHQVAPLLDALCDARVLITSRRRLASLGESLELGPLTTEESLELLAELAPQADLATDPAAARRLVEICGHLPLPLTLTAARLVEFPTWSLADQVRRLEAVSPVAGVRRALESSYAALPLQAGTFFRTIAGHPSDWICPFAAAAMTGLDINEAVRCLRLLHDEHLLALDEQGRGRLHDLVREFALSLSRDVDPHSSRSAAIVLLARHYAVAATVAVDLLRLTPPRDLPPPDPAAQVPPFASDHDARRWLTDESSSILNVARIVSEWGHNNDVARLAAAVTPWLEAEAHFGAARAIHTLAVRAEEKALRASAACALARIGQLAGEYGESLQWGELAVQLSEGEDLAAALLELAYVKIRLPDLLGAQTTFQQAIEVARKLGHRQHEGRGLSGEALALQMLGDFTASYPLFRQALAIAEEVEDLEGAAIVYGNLSYQLLLQERFAEAEEALRSCRMIEGRVGLRKHQPFTLIFLADTLSQSGRLDEAVELLLEARSMVTVEEFPASVTQFAIRRGEVHYRAGEYEQALEMYAEAAEILDAHEDQWSRTDLVNGMGETRLAMGQLPEARELLERGLASAREIGDPYETARSLLRLGEVASAEGDPTRARECWEESAEQFGLLGSPAADRVRALIDQIAA